MIKRTEQENFIEKVSRGSEIGVHVSGAPRKRMWLITVTMRDGNQKTVMSEGRCFAYMKYGFLVKVRREWWFYDVNGELVAKRTKNELGDCTDVSLGFYNFFNEEVGDLWIDYAGKEANLPPHGWVAISVKDVFKGGMSAFEGAGKDL